MALLAGLFELVARYGYAPALAAERPTGCWVVPLEPDAPERPEAHMAGWPAAHFAVEPAERALPAGLIELVGPAELMAHSNAVAPARAGLAVTATTAAHAAVMVAAPAGEAFADVDSGLRVAE